MKKKFGSFLLVLAVSGAVLAGCGQSAAPENSNAASRGQSAPAQETPASETKLSGEVKIDGSSTVFPITEAVAEEFQLAHPGVRVTVGVSGTGGGFKKFGAGETDISNASRPIKDAEKAAAEQNGMEVIEIPIAYDGLSVIVNKENTWVDQLTIEELNKIWSPESTVKLWSDVRPEWPKEEIKLYGPGTDSGTFDYFTEVVNGEAQKSRADYSASEDDNVLVQGVAGDKYSLGYFGYAYYEENADKLKLVPIVNKEGKAVLPSKETIMDGSYNPLSRPLYIYVSKKSLERQEVKEFVKFYLENASELVPSVYYVPLNPDEYQASLAKIQ